VLPLGAPNPGFICILSVALKVRLFIAPVDGNVILPSKVMLCLTYALVGVAGSHCVRDTNKKKHIIHILKIPPTKLNK
jgi:hypothetical protein